MILLSSYKCSVCAQTWLINGANMNPLVFMVQDALNQADCANHMVEQHGAMKLDYMEVGHGF